ncbi:sulfate permease-like protein [Lentithecium fluviatile CBS 122367]|uniref:Sulfate permease-like protein n=1 Tax=Lentithecium fluviatile CBS 122367 TaxID=1168545 RepID=A0A6G1IVZ0_9PLEO|nr:sulfate permease-like protein [Lentithecium fluviatile CBS 122367]
MADWFRDKVLHADPTEREEEKETLLKIARDTLGETYVEDDPSVAEFFAGLVPTKAHVAQYVHNLFPSASWVRRYNLHWLLGDAIAGVTVGLVVVPQAMAYALLARLTPAYGLYTTFTGACLYWIFGTSKDIVIGTTAVGSLLVGQVVASVEAAKPGVYSPQEIAHSLSFLSGMILLFLGFFRLGWLIEFIPYPPISAFVTSASITIVSTQLPTCLGITGINTRDSPYKVIINTLKKLPDTRLDAAIGITSIVLLFAIQKACAKMEVRQPSRKRMWSMISSLRLTFTILLYTMISWLVHRNTPADSRKFRIVGKIEKGFSHAGVPNLDPKLFGLVATELPAIVIILIVEHIAIAKEFGRIYGYKVIPSQEILAQGAANVLSPFVGGYVCTGSFGASAVLTKAGVRTPLAGLFSAGVLVLALYALTAVFYYIPNAALAGLIIHATLNLIAPPHKLYKYWKFSPFELGIWVIGVILAMFTDLEISIYAGIGLSFALILIRLARKPGKFTGRTRVTRTVRHQSAHPDGHPHSSASSVTETPELARDVYLPMQTSKPAHNPSVHVEPAYPGVFIYRFSENFNYINQANHTDHLLTHIRAHTRPTQLDDGIPPQDRLWSEAPRKPPGPGEQDIHTMPLLRAVILDFSNVNVIDLTSLQGLVDMRNTLDRYAAPSVVEWHFASVQNRWTRRALAFAGFGYPSTKNPDALGNWCPTYTVSTSFAGATAEDEHQGGLRRQRAQSQDEEKRGVMEHKLEANGMVVEEKSSSVPIYGVDRPFFHVDLVDAVDAAVRDARKRDQARGFDNPRVAVNGHGNGMV